MNSKTSDSAVKTPRGKRRRRPREELIEPILHAASEEFRKHGYFHAKVSDIAKKANVSEAQIFRYYTSKSNLFHEAVFKPLDEQLLEFSKREIPSNPEEFRQHFSTYNTRLLQFVTENIDVLNSLAVVNRYDPDGSADLSDADSLSAYFEHSAKFMERTMTAKPRIDPELMVRVSFASMLACVMFREWLFPKGLAEEDKIQDAISTFIIEGVSVNYRPNPTD